MSASPAGKTDCEMAIIGAGPYGLAAAAHLNAAKVDIRIFGEAMGFWRRNMPRGMMLRSPWRGNHIADPAGRLTLDRYAAESGIRHADPLPLEDFIAYGEWFQGKAVTGLDRRMVARVERTANGFRLLLEDGDPVSARRVLVATGLAKQEYRPPEFRDIPAERATHTLEPPDFGAFRGRPVAVIGRGHTACEFAVLLKEAGAEVELISRGGIFWTGSRKRGTADDRGLMHFLRTRLRPASPIGPFPLDWLIQSPAVFRRLPERYQQRIAEVSLRPTASSWLRDRAEGIRLTPGRSVTAARMAAGGIELHLDDGRALVVDHVVLATGYRTDVARQGILPADVVADIRQEEGSPLLSLGLESSVRGLHFAGSAAVHSLGPLLRSVWGAGWAARSLTRAVLAGR